MWGGALMISKAKLDKWLFWCTPAMSALGRLRQKDHKLKVNLGYTARPCLNKQWPCIYSGFWILNMTQVCTESGFPELAIGMTRSATKGHPSLFWSKDCQKALGAWQPRETGSLGSQKLWYPPFASQNQEKAHLCFLFLLCFPFLQQVSILCTFRETP